MNIVPYGEHDLQKIGIYSGQGSRWVVFIHGGAWRDPKRTLHDGDEWITSLEGVSTASLNYRLCPEVQHPAHLEDVIQGLNYLIQNYEVSEIILVGHSAGAFLSLQVVNSSSKTIVEKITKVVSVEGIVSLPELEQENSSYASFVSEAFGDDRNLWREYSPDSCPKPLVVVHSTEDELLDSTQPNLAMKLAPDTQFVSTTGTHNQVICSRTFGPIIQALV